MGHTGVGCVMKGCGGSWRGGVWVMFFELESLIKC